MCWYNILLGKKVIVWDGGKVQLFVKFLKQTSRPTFTCYFICISLTYWHRYKSVHLFFKWLLLHTDMSLYIVLFDDIRVDILQTKLCIGRQYDFLVICNIDLHKWCKYFDVQCCKCLYTLILYLTEDSTPFAEGIGAKQVENKNWENKITKFGYKGLYI